jgi:hypothetical protein
MITLYKSKKGNKMTIWVAFILFVTIINFICAACLITSFSINRAWLEENINLIHEKLKEHHFILSTYDLKKLEEDSFPQKWKDTLKDGK